MTNAGEPPFQKFPVFPFGETGRRGLNCPKTARKHTRKGVGTLAVSITKLKKQLMERIDQSDLVEVEKVERYIELVKSFRRMNKIISKEGERVITINGSQEFVKAHPLIAERNKINAQLINLDKSINYKTPLSEDEKKRSSLI